MWPATDQWGNGYPREIRTWTTYPYVSHLVRFDLGEGATRIGGGELEQYVFDGSAAAVPTLSFRPGYELYRWSEDFGCVSNSMTVAAIYRVNGKLQDGYNYTETVGDYTWTFSIVDGEAVIGVTDEYGNGRSQKAVSPEPKGALVVPETLGGCPVVELGYCALYDCDGMTSVTLPEALYEIGDHAFESCNRLSSIVIPDNVDTIGYEAFLDCNYLTTLEIPANVESIGERAFLYCSQLRNLTVSSDNPRFMADDGVLYDKAKTDLCFWPRQKRIELPQTLRNVRPYACYNNYATQNETLTFPSGVTNIGYEAFSSCRLSGIRLNEGLCSIGRYAFNDNYQLRYVVIPSTVERVEYSVFSSCQKMASVFFTGNAPETVYENFYSGTPSDLITFVRPGSTGWQSAGSSALPALWPTSGSCPRAIRTWTTYPNVAWLVTFDLGEGATRIGGGELEQMVLDGAAAEAPMLSCRPGYTFCGWDTDFDCITGAKTVQAVYVETGTPVIKNVEATVNPPWGRSVTVEYDGIGGNVGNKIARVYYYVDGSWCRVPASAITGAISLSKGYHSFALDMDAIDIEQGDLLFKIRVVEKAGDGIEVDNDDGWAEEDDSTWRSRKIGHNEETALYASVQGPGEFMFSWMTSSEGWCDRLTLYVDGDEQTFISGMTEWTDESIDLPEDEVYDIAWVYSKDGSVSSGKDCGWVCVDGVMCDVVCEVPVAVTIPEPTMELWAEMLADGRIELIPGFETATIYYTLDGSVPTEDSAVYTSPIAWSDFRKIRAVAVTDEGDWSEMLVGSEYVRIKFDAAGGTMDATTILRKIGEPIGELPEAERGDYGFNGWTPSYSETEGWIDEETEVESWWTTLYATWDIPVEDILDPNGTLDGIEINAEYWQQRTKSPWREYIRMACEVEAEDVFVAMAVDFSGIGMLSFETLKPGYGVVYLLDGKPCTVVNGQLKVLTAGDHRFEIAFENDAAEYSRWMYAYVGGMTWTPVNKSYRTVTFDANGGSVWPKSKTFAIGNTYGSLPTPSLGGFSFDGWYTSTYGGSHVTASDYVDFTADTLYAHWRGSVASAMGGDVSNVVVGNDDIYSDGTGIVFPMPTWDDDEWYGLPHVENNYFEVTCCGEAIISFDWVLDVAPNGSEDYWYGSANHRFTIDGNEVLTHEKDFGYQSVSMFYRDNPRKTVKAFLTPGTHVLHWEILSGYSYGCDVRCAVENFKVDEKPVANRESLFDWCKLGYEYFVWKPDNLDYLLTKYTARINKNRTDYDAYVWRALTKIVKLGENAKAREIIGRFGYTIADYTFMPSGEFVGLPLEVAQGFFFSLSFGFIVCGALATCGEFHLR